MSPVGILKTREHKVSEAISFRPQVSKLSRLRLVLSKEPNRVGVSPSPEDGNRSGFRNFVFSSF
jgi:hypothetical protein